MARKKPYRSVFVDLKATMSWASPPVCVRTRTGREAAPPATPLPAAALPLRRRRGSHLPPNLLGFKKRCRTKGHYQEPQRYSLAFTSLA